MTKQIYQERTQIFLRRVFFFIYSKHKNEENKLSGLNPEGQRKMYVHYKKLGGELKTE